MGVVKLDDKSFDAFVKGNESVVVDCYADWCMPCRMVSPIVDELSEEMDGTAFAKLNVDYSQNVAMRYGIMSIPTILFFRNGELADMAIGAMPKAMLKRKLFIRDKRVWQSVRVLSKRVASLLYPKYQGESSNLLISTSK